jgi:hypothetical protein
MDNRSFDATSSPASTGYSGQDSLVAVTDISDSGDTMTVTVSVHATGGAQSGDVEGRLKDIEARLAALEDAVSQGAAALSAFRQGGIAGVTSRRAPGVSGASDGKRGDGAVDALNAGFFAAAKAARDLVSEVQQWSPRRRI